MKKLLFFIPNLMHGGAEKVLVNLVNNLDTSKYDVTVQTIFDVGVNKQYLKPHIKYKYIFKNLFRGSTTIFKLFTPETLYKYFIKDEYDVIISYLEGPTSRILAGCNNEKIKKVAWIHIELNDSKSAALGYRNINEANHYYNKFNKIIAVSENVKECFVNSLNIKTEVEVLYNTNETEDILLKGKEIVNDVQFCSESINICSVAKIVHTKGYDRLAKVHKKLLEDGLNHKIYILGVGEERKNIENYLYKNNLEKTFILLGFKENPYKYISKCDLYVCSSRREGFSTAVTESLILGTPVLSTDCSGAKELLGYSNEYGIVVDNSEEGIYKGLKGILTNKNLLNYYKNQTKIRGDKFSRVKTVKAVEEMLDNL